MVDNATLSRCVVPVRIRSGPLKLFEILHGEAAKFQTKLIEIIEVDLPVHLIETIIDM